MKTPAVIYTAAHGGFSSERVPLGGGAAVCEHLLEEWGRTRPFQLTLLDPSILGPGAPSGSELVAFRESEYARFCRRFEQAVTAEVLHHDPANTVVLSNDISEGPDFRRLAETGFAVYTIYHVDVVAYVANIYAKRRIAPETMVLWYDRLDRSPLRFLAPDEARLVFDKQRDSLIYSRGIIVPSNGMKELILRCYPRTPPEKIHVIAWGAWNRPANLEERSEEVKRIRQEYALLDNALVLLALSRISPEKGQDLLLEALMEWERYGDLPARPVRLFLCGDAAFIQGKKHLEKLRALAGRLRRVGVVFPGHVGGVRKQALLDLADLYVFPSRHESYGLTLMEALNAGLPAVCLDHYGARSVMRQEFGEIVPMGSRREMVSGLHAAIKRLLADDAARHRMGEAARSYASTARFSDSAARLAGLLTQRV